METYCWYCNSHHKLEFECVPKIIPQSMLPLTSKLEMIKEIKKKEDLRENNSIRQKEK